MPKLRIVAVGAAALLALGLSTTACSGPTGPLEIPTTPGDQPERVDPTPADADAWADGILPENSVGGSPYTAREAGVLQPGAEPLISLAETVGADALLATVTIACVTAEASVLDYTVTSADGVLGAGEVACPAAGERAEPHRIPDLPREATVELAADAVGLYVWAAQPATDPAT